MNSNTPTPILEMFRSIQGEGPYIGTPALFIRFSKCNLSCPNCDTKYSLTESGTISIKEAIEFISLNPEYNLIVITGGEPLLYREEILKIVNSNGDRTHHFIIETNGTIYPGMKLLDDPTITFSISPKLIYLEKYKNIPCCFTENIFNNKYYFKFVVSSESIHLLSTQIKEIQSLQLPGEIILQPDNTSPDYIESLTNLVNYVKDNNLTQFRVIPQLHVLCWGKIRGI